MIEKRTLIVAEDGSVSVRGLDYEGRKLTVHKRNQNYLVIKVAGGGCWSGNYMPRRYVPAQFDVYRIISTKGDTIMAEPLVDFPIRLEAKDG